MRPEAARPDASTRYQPPASDHYTPNRISRPSPDAMSGARPGNSDARRPSNATTNDVRNPSSTSAGRPSAASVDANRRPGLEPRRPNADAPMASTRYRPTDTVAGNAVGRPTARPATTAGSAVARPIAAASTAVVAPIAPRLTAPVSITSGAVAHASSSSWCNNSCWNSCHHSTWCGFWDPWGCGNSCGCGWSFGFAFGGCGWGFSLCSPCWYGSQCGYWNNCYSDAYWCSWAHPYYGGYWWYPSGYYCPTYYGVPSGVYVEGEPAPAPAPGEPVVAGGGVVGSARAIDVGPDANSLASGLAVKYVELGDFYFKANRFHDAAEAYGKARSYAPNDASVHFVLADAVFADGDYAYAAFLINEGLRLDPAMASANTDKRTFYSDASVFETQMAALDAHLAKTPYDAQAHFVRGYNLCFSGKRDEAIAAFRRVLEIAPEHHGAQAFLAALTPHEDKGGDKGHKDD